MTTNELKSCPFCGSEAKLFADKKTHDWGAICQQPECECNARIPYCSTREEAIAQWNRRTPSAPIGVVGEAPEYTSACFDCRRLAGKPPAGVKRDDLCEWHANAWVRAYRVILEKSHE